MTSPPEVDKDALLVHAAITILEQECRIAHLERLQAPLTLEAVQLGGKKVRPSYAVMQAALREELERAKAGHRKSAEKLRGRTRV